MHKGQTTEDTESMIRGKLLTTDASGSCSSNDRVTAAPTPADDEAPPTRNRRGGRRAQRRAMLQELDAATKMVSTETVVVPVRNESVVLSVEKRPVNCTSVRRRAKPVSTITKVVTGVSLEDLRAKRNGTAAENVPDKDAKTIEEVSRILLMYASQQQQGGWRYHSLRRPASVPSVNSEFTTYGEGGSHMSATENTATMTSGSEAFVSGQQPPYCDGKFDSAHDVQMHVAELIRLGELPSDSLEILQAMLCHSSRGGGVDAFVASKKCRPSAAQPGFGPTERDLYQAQQQPPLQADYYYYHHHQQQQQLMDQAEKGFFGYGGCTSSTGPYYAAGENAPSDFVAIGCHATSGECVTSEYTEPFPLVGVHSQQQQQQPGQHWYNCSKATGEAMDCALAANTIENTMRRDTRNNDDDDDDADVTAMLHGIREAVQGVSSPQKPPQFASPEKMATVAGDHDGALSPSSPPAASVTISQSERETLRSIQMAFLSRMRVTGSSEWKSPHTSPLKNLLDSFAEDGVLDLQKTEEEQQCHYDEERRCAINRTLFLYRTGFPENDNGAISDETTMHAPSLGTATIQKQQPQEHCEGGAALTEAQLSELFSVMCGEAAQDDGEAKVLWPWMAGDRRYKKEGATTAAEDEAGVAAPEATTIATPTPSRWCGSSGNREERYTRSVSAVAATPQQPPTQKKLLLQDGHSPFSPAVCDFSMPTCQTTLDAAPLEKGRKQPVSVLNSNAVPFLPAHRATGITYFS